MLLTYIYIYIYIYIDIVPDVPDTSGESKNNIGPPSGGPKILQDMEFLDVDLGIWIWIWIEDEDHLNITSCKMGIDLRRRAKD